ncbi:cobalamin B12-binding domain-containing protein [Maliponia aquimaris]|uniref:B12 binding domain protein n=1 Tax=Maliponia aquimaris TaxID=1673631 RepID=A0A238KCK3_9RHOB|nr:cobalamin B12-binding domain-containing protein [Maliponia aquimaris]SMX40555.1 B12 binding domain protein [Maliponia aquimaris]
MIDFDEAFFQRAEDRAAALQAQLSEPALERLAREVVRRLTSRTARDMDSADAEHPTDTDIHVLCEALLHRDPGVALGMVQRLQARHLTLEVMYGRYLAPAAERLGAMWDHSRISFAEVTMGVSRIFELVHKLRAALPPPKITKQDQVLFASVPGETHSLGVEMAAELFRQKGWDVEVIVGASHGEILDRIERTRPPVVGLSSGGKQTAEALALLIHAIRAVDLDIYVIVSGVIVKEAPDLLSLVQPDSAVATVEEALATMDRLTAAHEGFEEKAAE